MAAVVHAPCWFSVLAALLAQLWCLHARADDHRPLPEYLRDRGPGIPTSMFGTYVRQSELLVFPFVAYCYDHDREYQPSTLGYPGGQDYLGHYRDLSEQLFIAYGVTDWLAVELEGSYVQAALQRDAADRSGTPPRIEESGLGDLEGELRGRLLRETPRWPELFAFLEITAPSNRKQVLIGDPLWDFKPGLGVIKGFSWGTVTFRTDLEYNQDDQAWDLGETSLEYLKRISPVGTARLAIEGGETGAPDEWTLDSGVYWTVADHVTLRIDNSLGVFPKAPDFTEQIGLMFSSLP